MFALLLRPQILDTQSQEQEVRASGLDWTIVQPVYLSDDASTAHFVSADGHVRSRRVSRRGVAQVHAGLVEDSSRIGETVTVSG